MIKTLNSLLFFALLTTPLNAQQLSGLPSLPATSSTLGSIKPDNSSIVVGPTGTLSSIGSQPASQYIAPQALAGCGIEYVSGLTYTVGACTYSINGTVYNSPMSNITLATADPTNPRIDVVFVDTTQVVQSITGTPAATPQQPVVDPSTQLELTFVLVPATATTPGNTVTVPIYLEGTEWTGSVGGTNSARVNLTSTSNPYLGTHDTEFGVGGTVTTTTFAQYTDPSSGTVNMSNYNALVFYMRNKAAWSKSRSVTVQWFNGSTPTGIPVVLSNGAFGFNATTNTTAYQQVSIPASTFGIPGVPVTSLQFTVSGSGAALTGFYLDQVTLQGGNGPLVFPSTLMNFKGAWSASATYATNDTVTSGGIGYVALAANTNIAVTTTATWRPLAPSAGSSTNSAQIWPALNGGTGTGANLLAGWSNTSNDSNFAITLPHPTTGQGGTNANPPMLGVCISSCGTSGLGNFQYQGSVQWICDNVVGVGDWVGPSPTVNGQCHDPVINTGVNSQQVNENPEANSAIGIVLTANASVGTAATILLMPHMGYGQTIFGANTGQGFALTSFGSPFTSTSEWTQRSLTATGSAGHAGAFSGHHPIDLWGPSGVGFCSIDNGDGGLGASTRDFGIDCLTNGQGSPPTESMYFNVSTYTKPTALTCTGTVGVIVTQTTGVYSCTLTGNTTFSTPTSDNVGHTLTYDIKQAAGSAFTVTWPGNFVNAPVMTTTLSASTVAKFYYDGTNYICTGGCPVTGGGGVTAIGVATANGVSGTSSGGSTPNLTIALGVITPTSVNGATVALGGFSNSSMLIGGGTMPNIQSIVVGTSVGANVGNNATVMGNNALSGATGGGNTVYGEGVLTTITSESFTNVDAFGQGAGSANGGSITNSLFLGDSAIGGSATLTNVNCIGQSQTCNTSNQTVLGNPSITSTILRGLAQVPGIMSTGTKFTTSGCSVSSTTGGATAGIFTLGANSCTVVITMNGATGMTATNGWTCQAHDRTAIADLILGESSSTTTTASIVIPVTAGATDVISFSCEAF